MASEAPTVGEIKKQVAKLLRKARFEMDEAHLEEGDAGSTFLWCKSRVETLEMVMWIIDPKWEG